MHPSAARIHEPRVCLACSKSIVQDSIQCVNCKTFFHPGCQGRRTCCDAPKLRRTAAAVSTISPPVPRTASNHQRGVGSVTPAASTSSNTLSQPTSRTGNLVSVQVAPATQQRTANDSSPHTLEEIYRRLNARFDEVCGQLNMLPALQGQVESNTTRIAALEQDNKALRDELSELRRLQVSGQAELRRTSSLMHKADIIVSGLPCTSETEQRTVIQEVSVALGCPLDDQDIISIRFLVAPARARQDTPIPLLVKLRSRELRTQVLAAKTRKVRLVTSDIGTLPPGPDRPIYLNGALSAELHKLLVEVKQVAKSKGLKYVWHRDGSILVRRTDGAAVVRINSAADLVRLQDY